MRWEEDKAWADGFTRDINEKIKPHVFSWRDAEIDEDRKKNTDTVWYMRSSSMRVRQFKYFKIGAFRHQFTVRSERDTGAETELSKISRGLGDLSVYAFAAPGSSSLVCQWVLYDLKSFGVHHKAGILKEFPFDNGDGTRGVAYDVRLVRGLDPAIIVAMWTDPSLQDHESWRPIKSSVAYEERMSRPKCVCGYRH